MNLLINPSALHQGGYTPPPLGLLYMAAMDEDTVIYDAALRGTRPPDMSKARMVGASMHTMMRHNALAYLREAKKQGATTVAGGIHVTLMLSQMVEHYGHFIDHFVLGDGELAWKALCNGQDMPQVIKMRVEDLDTLPLPAWERIDFHRYPGLGKKIQTHRGINLTSTPRVSIVLGRGCTGSCMFCSAWWVNGKLRSHGEDWIGAHLEHLWNMGVRHLVFQDDCLTDDRQAALRLFDKLERYTFSWHATTRADKLDLELALRMADVGCYQLAFGIESGSLMLLEKLHKQANLSNAFEAREACRQAKIHFTALIMRGLPYSTLETGQETAAFLAQLQPDSIGSQGFTWVFPGTALYQACKRAGLITDNFWLGNTPGYIYRGGLK